MLLPPVRWSRIYTDASPYPGWCAIPASRELPADSGKGASGSTLHAIETLLIRPPPDDNQAISKFVEELKREYPPAAAGLLAKMLPSGDAEEKASNYGPVTIQVVSIPSDRYLSREQARQLAGLPPDEPQPEPVDLTPTMIEDLRPEGGPPKLVINNDPDSAA